MYWPLTSGHACRTAATAQSGSCVRCQYPRSRAILVYAHQRCSRFCVPPPSRSGTWISSKKAEGQGQGSVCAAQLGTLMIDPFLRPTAARGELAGHVLAFGSPHTCRPGCSVSTTHWSYSCPLFLYMPQLAMANHRSTAAAIASSSACAAAAASATAANVVDKSKRGRH